MVSIKKYAKTITQTSGRYAVQKSYSEFGNLNNLKDESNTTSTSNITAADGIKNRPSTLKFSDFDFKIPDGGTVEKIRVHYRMKKTASGNTDVNVGPVVFRVKGAGAEFEFAGKAPTSIESDFTSEYDATSIIGVNTGNVNTSFQLEMEFPANTGGAGSIDLGYVLVEIVYSEGVYVLSAVTDKKQIVEKDTFDITLSLTNIAQKNRYYCPTTLITIPDGVTYLGSDDDSFIEKSGNTLKWTSLFIAEWVDTITLTFQAVTSGDKRFKMNENTSENPYSFQLVLGVAPKVTQLDFNLPEYGTEDKSFNFTALSIDFSKEWGNSSIEARSVKIELPTQFNIIIDNKDEDATIDTSSEEKTVITWNIPANVDSRMLSCTVTPLQSGLFTFKGYDSDNVLIASENIKISPSSYTTPFLSKYKLPDSVRDKMEDGRSYILVSYMRVNISDEDMDNFEQFKLNHRLSVFHDSGSAEDYQNNQYLLDNAIELSKNITTPNTWVKFEISFHYDEKYPVYIFWTGEYMERTPTVFNIEFTNPILEEVPYYRNKGVEPYGLYFNPLKSVISPTKYGSCIIPALGKANPFRVSGLQFGGAENIENFVLQGITIHFDAISSSDCSIVARLYADNKMGERSITLHQGSQTLEIGGPFDLFGIKYTDFMDPTRLELEFEAINKYNHDVKLQISNIYLTIRYSILGNNNWVKFWIDGESSEYYNVFLKKLTIDGGAETSVTYFSAEGCDTTIASRQNIEPKTLEMEVEIGECNIDEATLLFRRAAKWFSNDRTKYNKPILKNIEFEHIPGQIYPYILEKPLDGKLEFNVYDSKIKLKVPDGLSISKEPTFTAEVGVVAGITRVKPIIRARVLSDEITITEKYSKQSWSIYSDSLDIGDTLTIDCGKRTVILDKSSTTGQTNLDITCDVDFDCDWFSIKGEFVFQSSSCSIQSVEYKEREL